MKQTPTGAYNLAPDQILRNRRGLLEVPHAMPQKAAADALHVASAALGGVKYLLTLNCKHIANAHELPRIYELLDREGFGQMLICTPAEFLGGDSYDEETTDS